MIVYTKKDVDRMVDDLFDHPLGASLSALAAIYLMAVGISGFLGLTDGFQEAGRRYATSECRTRLCRMTIGYPIGWSLGRWLGAKDE